MIQIKSNVMATPQPASSPSDVLIRPAVEDEAADIFRLISDNLAVGHLLPRSFDEVAIHIPRFFVAVGSNGVIACGELAELSPRVVEVRSFVVSEPYRKQGFGKQLLTEILATARSQGFPLLCAFTHNPRTFIKLGFSIVPHHWIPEKVSINCHSCVWFRRCHQYAVVFDLKSRTSQA